ncbi:MAG: PTS transporter subunit IIC [Candidatus Bathyarchaeia archaeon]
MVDLIGFLKSIWDVLNAGGPAVFMPIIMFIFALAFRMSIRRAFEAALRLGIAYTGIFLILEFMLKAIGEASRVMVERTGAQFVALDAGWPVMAAIAFATPVGMLVIIVGLLVNLLLIVLRLTKTIDVDIWDYWHAAFAGAIALILTGDMPLALLVAAFTQVYAIKHADWTKKMLWEVWPGYKGYTIVVDWLVSSWIGIWAKAIIERVVPKINKVRADVEGIKLKLGLAGEPAVLGLIIGAAIGIAAGYNVIEVLILAIQSATVFILLPIVAGMLMEGLVPIAEGVRDFMMKRYAGREIYIGMDSAITIGHPAVILLTTLTAPIYIIAALTLPGNQILPYADIIAPYWWAGVIALTAGNILFSVLIAIPIIIVFLLIANLIWPAYTNIALSVGAIEAGQKVGFIWVEPAFIVGFIAGKLTSIQIAYIFVIILIIITALSDRIKGLANAFSRLAYSSASSREEN